MQHPEEPARPARALAARRAVVTVLALLLGWHLLASALWIAPSSPARDVVPGDTLREYMLPMFGQSWSLFAPDPVSADYYFDVRAVVGEGDDAATTEWVRASDIELSRATYHLFPPRSASSAIAQAMLLRGAWGDLSKDQKDVASAHYYKGEDWSSRLHEDLVAAGGTDEVRRTFEEEDAASIAYATRVAVAVWGEDVQRVQYRVARHPVVPFDARHDPTSARPSPAFVEPGWRGAERASPEAQTLFTEYFCSAPAQVCEV